MSKIGAKCNFNDVYRMTDDYLRLNKITRKEYDMINNYVLSLTSKDTQISNLSNELEHYKYMAISCKKIIEDQDATIQLLKQKINELNI